MEIKEFQKTAVRDSKSVADILWSILASEDEIDRDKEHFWTIGLDSKNIIKFIDLVSLGTLNSATVHPRETFRLAIMKAVANIIIAHNHPSGDPEPSMEDRAITDKMIKAGEIIGIRCIDSIIIGDRTFRSLLQNLQGGEVI